MGTRTDCVIEWLEDSVNKMMERYMNLFQPHGGGRHHMQLDAYTESDAYLLPLCPRELRLKIIARKILRAHNMFEGRTWPRFSLPQSRPVEEFTFSLPGEKTVYEILNTIGETRLYRPTAPSDTKKTDSSLPT